MLSDYLIANEKIEADEFVKLMNGDLKTETEAEESVDDVIDPSVEADE